VLSFFLKHTTVYMPSVKFSESPPSPSQAKRKRSAHGHDDAITHSMGLVARHPLLTPEQEIVYGHKVRKMMDIVEAQGCDKIADANRTGNEKIFTEGLNAREKMFLGNLRLVRGMVKKYSTRLTVSFDRSDAISEGDQGLLRAIEKFDPERGYRFSTYATWWIRQAITRMIPQSGTSIRLPIHILEQRSKLRQALSQIDLEGAILTPEELARELERRTGLRPSQCSAENIRFIGQVSIPVMSLSTELAPGLDLDSVIPGTDETWELAEKEEAVETLEKLMAAAKLSEEARTIIQYHSGIRQLDADDMRKLREHPKRPAALNKVNPTISLAIAGYLTKNLGPERSRTLHSSALRAMKNQAQKMGYTVNRD
jgi:RNA polymerase sigma factor (sigma-70 family)